MMFSFPLFVGATLLAHLMAELPQDALYPIDAALSGSIGSTNVGSTEPFQLSVAQRDGLLDFEVWADADAERSAMVQVSVDLRALQAGEDGRVALIARSGRDPWRWAFETVAQSTRSRVERIDPDTTLLLVEAELSSGERVQTQIELSSAPDTP